MGLLVQQFAAYNTVSVIEERGIRFQRGGHALLHSTLLRL